jgi:ADP-heptose:LPS heptosyltransferase
VDLDRRPVLLTHRALNLGDLLVAIPALRALRRAYPHHRHVLATSPVLAPLVDRTGAVDTLVPTVDPSAIPWSGNAPEVGVNLHGTGPQSHAALAALLPRRRIGFRCAAAGPGWEGPSWADVAAVHPHERERWCALLTAVGIAADPGDLRLDAGGPSGAPAHVLVHPGARHGAKRWPPDRFAEVAAALNRAVAPVLITGSAEEHTVASAVATQAGLGPDRVLAGCTDLAQLCDLVAGAALVVSGDTGIAHLASAFATPSVVLFGPVDPAQWGPPSTGPHRALSRLDGRRGDPFAATPDPALLAISVDDVLAAVADVLASPRPDEPGHRPG